MYILVKCRNKIRDLKIENQTEGHVARPWTCCVLSRYLFISVSCLQTAPTLKLQRCPKLEPDFWEARRWWMFFLGPERKIG